MRDLIVKPSRDSVAEQVFRGLHASILSMELAPGTRMSEAETARQFGVSRQPVRDAFFRLSRIGFLEIRPQSGTTVRLISAAAVERGRFVRTVLETAVIRQAAVVFNSDDLAAIGKIVEQQAMAADLQDYAGFHALDDLMHQDICKRAELGYIWDLIRPQKAHMDRVRFLTLDIGSRQALQEHRQILDALRQADPDLAEAQMRGHLSHITRLVAEARVKYAHAFDPEDAPVDPLPAFEDVPRR